MSEERLTLKEAAETMQTETDTDTSYVLFCFHDTFLPGRPTLLNRLGEDGKYFTPVFSRWGAKAYAEYYLGQNSNVPGLRVVAAQIGSSRYLSYMRQIVG